METDHSGHLLVDLRRQVVMLDDQRLTLTPKEHYLLALLAQHVGAVVPRATILRRMWGHAPELRITRVGFTRWRAEQKWRRFETRINTNRIVMNTYS
jgi:DNA-binding response OmpR family regulator